ncbi:hypothetical protein Tph_c09640 [Thermacetogenium phaeum DSM 12270]|uniref:Uncharacterized protein n=2 Tax=Thermacetogenium phaeum TaxID=85874 RepID=K4LEA0_THEPS|nr:hypothetical protein [Thermacetogenium phaeum]AFV11193.1 hypothetical protein Tph_c09640 [Thermacetogenium phaeum DSM 12270]KUK36988.1 MAG: Uncharacterized protein XD66_0294 [Thermacetogenium phaeum]MDK2881279.1 hypothetical protein [Clostridia bacterium]MDN5375595.1 hypothetical protein [Thermacetogenium sp.]
MTTGCPVCNGLTPIEETCPSCGALMEDCGSMADLSDPYGPYEEKRENIAGYTGDNLCLHFLQCPNCDESISHTVTGSNVI